MENGDSMTDELEKANPFYHQHVFSEKDLKRSVATWRDKMRFMFRPTCVQIACDCNKVFFFKQKGSREILITKIEEFSV